jgi:hypothetical protein
VSKWLSSLFLPGALLSGSAALAQTTITPADIQAMQKNVIATGIDFDFDAAIGPAVGKYSGCVATNRAKYVGNGTPQFLSATQHAIVKCRKVRKEAMAEAELALARQPGWESPSRRTAEVDSAFDNTDASARKLARETNAYFERRN